MRFLFLLICLASFNTLLLAQNVWAVSSNVTKQNIEFPKYFYGASAGSNQCTSCPIPFSLLRFKSASEATRIITKVIGYDWEADHKKNSNSLSVNHENLSVPARELFAFAQRSIAEKNKTRIHKAIEIINQIAQDNTLFNTPSLADVRMGGGKCYGGENKISAVCRIHLPEFAVDFVANYLITASLLKNFMSLNERANVSNYADKMYHRFIIPVAADKIKSRGFTAMADGGIALLAYAYWHEDKKLALEAFNNIFDNIGEVFLKDGYIRGSSFRGVRGFWYHSYGTNSALASLALADLWGYNTPENVREKIRKATNLLNTGIDDIEKFYSRPDPDRMQTNATYDENYARNHLHQMAIGIAVLAKIAVDINLNIQKDVSYLKKSANEFPSDFTIGFNPYCMGQANDVSGEKIKFDKVSQFYSDRPWLFKRQKESENKERHYYRTKKGLAKRVQCFVEFAKRNNLSEIPTEIELETLISNLAGNKYYRTLRHLKKAGLSELSLQKNKSALLRLVNFEGSNDEYCKKPVL